MNREDFIKFIPKPKNEEVIIYDISLKDLIDVDVVLEYNNLYSVYMEKKSKFEQLENELKIYKKNINELPLYNPSWSEEDYLMKLKDDKRTYSTLYSNIKRNEDNIKILQKKINATNEKIEMQKIKENNERQKKSQNINADISENKEKLIKYKNIIDIYKHSLKRIEEDINDVNKNLKLLNGQKDKLQKGNFECICCGKKIKAKDDMTIVYSGIQEKFLRNQSELKELEENHDKIEMNLAFYESELSNVKQKLNNDIEFKKNSKNIYIKKSIEILKLEALKDDMYKKIEKMQTEINQDSHLNSKNFQKIKNRIELYENSLINLRKIKEIKMILRDNVDNYKNKKEELNNIENKLNKYLKFLSIYYKIYEQKANNYCGNDYKFKLFKIENYKIINIFQLYYKGVEYSQISKEDKDIVDRTIIEKFSVYI